MTQPPHKSLSRSLGEFFGHLWHGVTADPAREKKVIKREVEEETSPTPDGQITLRRTTIEEVEIRRDR